METRSMSIRDHLNDDYRATWDRHFHKALAGTGDARQSEQVANERTLLEVMKASAAIAHVRAVAAGVTQCMEPPWMQRR